WECWTGRLLWREVGGEHTRDGQACEEDNEGWELHDDEQCREDWKTNGKMQEQGERKKNDVIKRQYAQEAKINTTKTTQREAVTDAREEHQCKDRRHPQGKT